MSTQRHHGRLKAQIPQFILLSVVLLPLLVLGWTKHQPQSASAADTGDQLNRVAVNVDASDKIRTVDPRLFGINTGMWYTDLNAPDTVAALNEMGNRALRFPGGRLSDQYDWATNRTLGDNNPWVSAMADFAALVEKTHSAAFITVNYSSGTAQEAAALVAWANASPSNTPDFVIEHYYAQNPGEESDAGLLQSAKTWSTIVSGLRGQLNDYLGPARAVRIQIDCTENNSVSANPGKQTTSLVNGLYLAASIGEAMQTEIHALLWWDLRDGDLLKHNNDRTTLYGRRENGSYNVMASATDYYPTFYARKLLTHFAAGGDRVIQAKSDYDLLDPFAVRRTDHSLTVLLINKNPANPLDGTITLTGFHAAPTAAVYSYGMAQDTAASTGAGSHDIATTTITVNGAGPTFTIPPYTMEVIVLHPAVS